MVDRLKGKVAVITGAASGIGAETARLFAREGARLVLGDIQAEKGQAIATELGAVFQKTDVTQESQVAALVDLAVSTYGQLDIMLSNAGVLGAVGPITGITAEAWDKTMAIHVTSVFFGTKHATRVMMKQGKGGCILATASTAGVAAMGPLPYSTAKTAVTGLVRAAAAELAPHNIRVNAVAPGTVPTELTGQIYGGNEATVARSKEVSPMGRPMEPIDIAAAYLYLASEDGRFVTGQTLVVDAGATTVRGEARYAQQEAKFVAAYEANDR